MRRLRIRAKAPPSPTRKLGENFPAVNGTIPSWMDVELHLIDDDGNETPLTCVERVELDIKASAEPLRATIHVVGVELDIDARIDEVVDMLARKVVNRV